MKKNLLMLLKYTTEKTSESLLIFPSFSMARIPIGPPIIEEEIDTLDQSKNPVFKNAKAIIFWLLKMVKSQVELQ